MDDRLLKPIEVDILFRYPTGRTMRLVRQGKIPFVRLPDGEVRIRESFVRDFVESQSKEPGNE